MQTIRMLAATITLFSLCSFSIAQDYRFEAIDSGPQADEIPAEFAKTFAEQGTRVVRGTSRTVSEIWLAREIEVEANFEPTEERLYPFVPGQLIGLLHFTRRGSDFRDQSVSRGWYTLRFGLQPIDGNHEGTSPTRDFLVMVNIEHDEPEKIWAEKDLNDAGAEAAGSTHPAMVCLQKPVAEGEQAIRHNEEHDWWILHSIGNGISDGKPIKLGIDMVVAGHASE